MEEMLERTFQLKSTLKGKTLAEVIQGLLRNKIFRKIKYKG